MSANPSAPAAAAAALNSVNANLPTVTFGHMPGRPVMMFAMRGQGPLFHPFTFLQQASAADFNSLMGVIKLIDPKITPEGLNGLSMEKMCRIAQTAFLTATDDNTREALTIFFQDEGVDPEAEESAFQQFWQSIGVSVENQKRNEDLRKLVLNLRDKLKPVVTPPTPQQLNDALNALKGLFLKRFQQVDAIADKAFAILKQQLATFKQNVTQAHAKEANAGGKVAVPTSGNYHQDLNSCITNLMKQIIDFMHNLKNVLMDLKDSTNLTFMLLN
jgi:hypothetical protein